MLRFSANVIRRRPKTAFLLVLLTAAGAAYGFFHFEWRRAQAALRDGKGADARASLERCLWLWPRSTQVHLAAARAARLTGDFEATENHLNHCLKLEKGATQAIQLEFLLLRAQTGEADDVAVTLLDYIDNHEENRELILQTLARAFMHHLRYGPAYVCLSRWIGVNPAVARPYYWRGWVLERLNNSDGAMKDYLRALELDPDSPVIRIHVAEMYLADNKPHDALPHLERLRRQAPERADVMARLGQCRYLQGQNEEARRLLETALRELPDDLQLLLHLAKLDLQDGKAIDAERRLRHIIKLDIAYSEAHYNLASALQMQNRMEEAKKALADYQNYRTTLEQANKLLRHEAQHPSNDPVIATEIGTLLLKIGHDRSGAYWLDQALMRDPNHLPAHRAFADFFESKGLADKAAVHRQRLAELEKK
jgi:Flp pilus assembly protein TadD